MIKKIFLCMLIVNMFSLIKAEENVQNQFTVIFPVTLVSPGMANELVEMFEEEYKVPTKMISLCTGDAVKLIRTGTERIDAMLGHDPDAEEKLVRDGYALNRRPICYSDYYLVGPADDPAGIKGITSVTEALKKIKDKKAFFFSRGDDSGTHKLELKMWNKANIKPKGDWYVVTNAGTDVTLSLASKKKGYFISHSATYMDMKDTIDLDILLKSPDLVTPYHVMALNPQKSPNVDYLNALKLIEFLTSPKVQKYIADYGIEKYKGQTFFPLLEEVKMEGIKSSYPYGVNLSGYLQVQYTVDESTGPDNILIRRARLIASSNLSEKIDWKIMLDGAAAQVLWEACMSYAASPYAKITAGQFKVPFSAEYLTSSAKLDTVENCQAVTKLSPQYDIGTAVNGNLGIMGYAVGIFDGEGRNKADANRDKDAAVRIVLAPKKDIEIGVAYYDSTSGAIRTKRNCSDISFSTLFDKLSIKGEYMLSREKVLDKQGGYFQAMYKLSSSLEPLIRYDTFDPDTNTLNDVADIYLIGLNYYINSNAKIQANYLIKQENPEINNNSFYIQAQVSY